MKKNIGIKFSLIIPVAPWRKAKILESIKFLNYPKRDFEIIVEKGNNASENRNRGIKKSKGRFVVFLDDDAYLRENYLKEIDRFFEKYSEIDIVGGPQLTPREDKFFAQISGVVLTSNFGAFKVNKRYKKSKLNLDANETFLTSSNLCIKSDVFNKIKGFNKNLYPGEDPELISRAKKAGMKIAYNPEMIIYHKRRGNFSSFCKQIFNYGFVRPKKNKISGETKIFFLMPMLFTLYFLFLPFLVLVNILFIVPLTVYIVLSVLFSIYDSIKHKNLIGFFALPFLYLFVHLSYGLGMIAGYASK